MPISGLVVDENDHPAAGVVVEALLRDGRPSCTSADDGRFVLELPNRSHRYLILHAGAAADTRQAVHALREVDEPPPPVKLVLRSAREFAVRVVDGLRQPVANASVVMGIYPDHPNEAFTGTTTDDAGQALLRVPADAPPAYILATKRDVGLDYFVFRRPISSIFNGYALPPEQSEPPELVLDGVRTVDVRVVDEQGQPMAGVPVRPWLCEKPKKGAALGLEGVNELYVHTDAQGNAVFRALPSDALGKIQFAANRDGHYQDEKTTFDPQGEMTELTVKLLPLTRVRGKVSLVDGRPAGGAHVMVDGSGYAEVTSQQSVRAGMDGRFEIGVRPDKFYVFVAFLDQWATAAQTRVVRQGQAPEDLELVLQNATRIYGRRTVGEDRQPVPGEFVTLSLQINGDVHGQLARERQLPNPTNSPRELTPSIRQSQLTGENGEFEFFAGPGKLKLMTPGDLDPIEFDVIDQPALELNLHTDCLTSVEFAGRVVLRADPRKGVGELDIKSALPAAFPSSPIRRGLNWFRAVTGAEGEFWVLRGRKEMWLHARTDDNLLAGIVHLGPDDPSCLISLAPAASTRGRLIDSNTGRPLPGRQVTYGWVQEDNMGPRSLVEFGGEVSTNALGEFVVPGLTVGWSFKLSVRVATTARVGPGQAVARHVGFVKPKRAELVDLGDVRVSESSTTASRTLADVMGGVFEANQPIDERFRKRLREAMFGQRRLLVLFAAHDSAIAWRFGSIFFRVEDENEDADDLRQALGNYVLMAIDAEPSHPQGAPRRWVEGIHLAWPEFDDAVFAVLDTNGRPLAQITGTELSTGGELDLTRLSQFLRGQAPARPDAEQLFAAAFKQAKEQGKHVLVEQCSAFSAPCLLLSRFLDAQSELLAKDFVVVMVDARLPHGQQVIDRIRPKQGSEIPWIAILDAEGNQLATSDVAGGNFGFPSTPEAVADFETIIRRTTTHLRDEEIGRLVKGLSR
ncbi:MAG TPA: hypothetical protein VND64_12605, partial [Pirellulales bacterium]|nr:hypothetical protein [Pirellulales bacterium]